MSGKHITEANSATIIALKNTLDIDKGKTLYRFIGFIDQDVHLQISGLLITGHRYKITSFNEGDDFLNVGATNNVLGEIFTATGTTPTVYTNGSCLSDFTLMKPILTPFNNDSDFYLSSLSTDIIMSGFYKIMIPGGFDPDLTLVRMAGTPSEDMAGKIVCRVDDGGYITIAVTVDGDLADGVLAREPIEILVKVPVI